MNDATLRSTLEELADTIARKVVELQAERMSSPPCERSPWLSIEHAAAHLDLPKGRLYKLSASGEIPHYKQGNRLLFRRDELDRWLDAKRASGGTR